MDIEFIKAFLKPELMFLVVFLIAVGALLKKWPKVADWTIPLVLWGVGIVYTVLWFGVIDGNGITLAVFFNGSVQGTYVAALAVFGNNVYKQIAKEFMTKGEADE